MKWFTRTWYIYLFENLHGELLRTKITKIICRIKQHPCGPIYYCHGTEPDMRCKNCGDEL